MPLFHRFASLATPHWALVSLVVSASACSSNERKFGDPADGGVRDSSVLDGEAGPLGSNSGHTSDADADALVSRDGSVAEASVLPEGAVADAGSHAPDADSDVPDAGSNVPDAGRNVPDADSSVDILDSASTLDAHAACTPSMPTVPRPIAPANGSHSGSTIAAPSHPTLRPSFRWSGVDSGDGCTTYHLQVDDSCSPGTLMQACAFGSPVIDATALATNTFRPAADLPVSTTTRPLGARYYWRVRACRAGTCSAFSSVRYVDVGRVPGDFDGDGFSDVAISNTNDPHPWGSQSGVFVLSGPVPASSSSVRPFVGFDADAGTKAVGRSLAVGDMNGDGFADLAVGAQGTLEIFMGGADGIVKTRSTTLAPPSENTVYGASAAVGDWNGDGFADIAVGAAYYDGSDRGSAFVYYGAAAGVNTTAGVTLSATLPTDRAQWGGFGFRLASAGDMDGDGRDELAAAAPFTKGNGYQAGAAYVFRGASTGIGAVPWAVLDLANAGSDAGSSAFGISMAAGDTNGDGLSDLAIAQQRSPTVVVYAGGANPPDAGRATLLDLPGRNGVPSPALSVGDLNGDSWDDLVVGDPQQEAGADAEGNVVVFYGNGQNWAASTGRYAVLDSPQNVANGRFGSAVWAIGDLNGDGISDLLAGAPMASGSGGAAYVFLGSTAGLPASPWARLIPWSSGDGFGLRVACREPLVRRVLN